MKIRKLYMAVFSIFISAQITSAQQNMFVVDNNGNVNVVSVSSVNYATFNANNKWFTITNDGIEATTNTSFSASCTVSLAADSTVKGLATTPQVGVCYSKDNNTPTIADDCESVGTQLKSYAFTLSPLTSGTMYYYRVYVKLADGVFYGDVAKVKTFGTAPNDTIINGHKFIDLSLPSGLLWAETNIGAKKAADDGNYYAWGETTTKSIYSYDNYFDSKDRIYSTTEWTTLVDENDAAYVNWGRSCRMPTNDEFAELHNSSNCTWTWTSMNNSDGSSIKGYKVTSVKNGNSIFLPASGYCDDEVLRSHGSYGNYWSNTLYSYDSLYAYGLYFSSSYPGQNGHYRCDGCTIRPVAEP